ncbi:MAG: T9SS type A sorting domain-containing protein [Bacteroidales bacterium]|nr:T9SS type A sorting domain-containing protein [Bacteroidales bacterium]
MYTLKTSTYAKKMSVKPTVKNLTSTAKTFRILFLAMLMLCFSGYVFAQISIDADLPSSKFKIRNDAVKTIEMPVQRNKALLEEALLEDKQKNVPPKFGEKIPVSINLKNAGNWTKLPNGDRLWRLKIKSRDALMLNLLYKEFFMPDGAQFFLYNPANDNILGAFTDINNKNDGKFATGFTLGDEVILEYFEPASVKGQGKIDIAYVVHGFRYINDQTRGYGSSGKCNNNVACPEGDPWRDQIKSVALILVNGHRICSGCLVNNTAEDQRPLFMTANHCIGKLDAVSNPNANSYTFVFNYESPTCKNKNGKLNQSVVGGKLLSNYKASSKDMGSDFALFELAESPLDAGYDVYFSGFDSRNNQGKSGATGIHHPSGDVKKISFEYDALTKGQFYSNRTTHWKIKDWDDGTTEGGSSGSPLYDNTNGRQIGVLSGGGAACNNNAADYYGGFFHSWTNENNQSSKRRLDVHLDPIGKGTNRYIDGNDFKPGTSITIIEVKTDCNGNNHSRNQIVFSVKNSNATPTSNKGTIRAYGNNWLLEHIGAAFGSTVNYTIKVKSVSKTQSVTTVKGCNTVEEYSITASAGANGTISPKGTIVVTKGSNKTFTISANSGYEIKDVLVDDKSVGAVSSYKFKNVSANHSIKALFTSTGSVDIEITDIVPGCDNNGEAMNEIYFTVNIPHTDVKSWYGKLSKLGNYNYKIVEKNVGFGNELDYVIDVFDGSTKIATKKIYVTSVSSCNSVKEYTISATADANGSISPSGKVKVKEGTSQTFTITANAGYKVKDVRIDGKSEGAKTKYTFNSVNANHTIEASFAKDGGTNAVLIKDVFTDCNKKGKARNIIYLNVSVPHNSVTVNRGYVINQGNGNYKIRDVGMPKGSTYTYKITAKNGSKVVGTASKAVKAVSGCRKAAESIVAKKSTFTISPNPAGDVVNISSAGYSNATILIYDVHGKVVLKHNHVENETTLNTSELSAGMYLIRISCNKQTGIQQLIIK